MSSARRVIAQTMLVVRGRGFRWWKTGRCMMAVSKKATRGAIVECIPERSRKASAIAKRGSQCRSTCCRREWPLLWAFDVYPAV